LFFGTGLATWEYQFSLYRPLGLNLTDFWQVRFSQGSGILAMLLATSGVLGVLAFLAIIAFFLYQGMKMIFGKEKEKNSAGGEEASSDLRETKTALFSVGLYLFFLFFFYPLNFSLGTAAFIILGLWVSIFYQKETSFSFTQSPQKAFFVMLIGVGLVAGSIICLFKVSQRYKAALIYSEGIGLINSQERKLDEGIEKISQAANLDPKDIYFRNLAEALLMKIGEVAQNQGLSNEEKSKTLQSIVVSTESAAAAAVKANPSNSQNWLEIAAVYENLFSLGVEKADEMAISNYQKAKKLDPLNPQIDFSIARTYKALAEKAKGDEAKKEDYTKNLNLALDYCDKAIELKINYSVAYYLEGLVYEMDGQKDKALDDYRVVLELEPGNEEITKKIEELTK